jgi:Cd2+/Zn2+-exporting ATPase
VKKEFVLKGLTCANCAGKIEREAALIQGVSSASVNLMAQILTLEVAPSGQKAASKEVVKIVKTHEPSVKVLEKDSADSHEAEEDERKSPLKLICLIVGAVLFALGLLLKLAEPWSLALFSLAYLLVGGEVLLKAIKNIFKGKVFDENFLMTLATVGAFATHYYSEGVAVMLFYQVGEAFQDMAVNRSRKSISALMDIRPDYANLLTEGRARRVNPKDVHVGDLIQVKAGERIPLDGVVVKGTAMLDTAAITGESLPREAKEGDEVLSGSINTSGLLTLKVTKEFGESTVSKILDLVQNASGRKSQTESFISKFARIYTPVVVFAAVALALLPPLLLQDASFSEWLHRALVFLVVSCPCALVISIPLSFFGGLGGASRSGILIKGGNYLEALNNTEIAVFDKTGTLTQGKFGVSELHPAEGFTEEELLYLAACAEQSSSHPIARSIVEAYGKSLEAAVVESYEELAGKGISVLIDGKAVLAGNSELLRSKGVEFSSTQEGATVVHIAADGRYAGCILLADTLKPDSAETIRQLKAMGIKTAMLTGDNSSAAAKAAAELGVDEYYAQLLPHQKVEKLELLAKSKAPKGSLIFVGDGINDAPVLAAADVGIAMGGVGSDAAIEAADAVIMTDAPYKLVTAIKIARKTRRIVMQNIIFALGVKAIILVLGAFGIAGMWEAVFGDVGVALIAVLNAMRALKVIDNA